MKRSSWIIGSGLAVFLLIPLFVAYAFTPTPNPPSPTPIPNRAPFARAKMSVDNGKTYSAAVTVTQGVKVPVRITAGEKGAPGSFDPDGWDTVAKGVSKGGKIEWNNNLWLGEPKFEKTFINPVSPSSADMNLGDKVFTLAPGTYTYNMLKITDAGGLASNIGAVTVTVVANPNAGANRAPFAVAKMSIDDGKTYSSAVTVTQGVRVPVRITAGEKGGKGSFDPDGWDTVAKGVLKGGKIEWNNNLWLGEPKFEKTFTNPVSPSSADMNLGDKVFTLAPGTYTYNLLKITDAGGLVSNVGTIELTVLAPGSDSCNAYDGDNGYDGTCGDPNGYDGNGYDPTGYDSQLSGSSNSFTAIITSPSAGTVVPKGTNLPVAVTGKGKSVCGTWILRTPSGKTVALTSADFLSGAMPGNLAACN